MIDLNKDARIYVAGHSGMVGSAIIRELNAKGYDNILTATHTELDLTNQEEVHRFFQVNNRNMFLLRRPG